MVAIGAWGMRAFENDTALDYVVRLCDKDFIIEQIAFANEYVKDYPKTAHLDDTVDFYIHSSPDVGFAAAETIAAAITGRASYQTDGITFMPKLYGVANQVKEYLPEEIDKWLEKERPEFSKETIGLAINVLDGLCKQEFTQDWLEPQERIDALVATRERLRSVFV